MEHVNGFDPDVTAKRIHFDALIPIYPTERLKLEHGSNNKAIRIIDLVSSIAKGKEV